MTQARELIRTSLSLGVLTGAGVSTESGIPDFKSVDQSWTEPVSRHEAISLRYFQKNPQDFWRIYMRTFASKMNAVPSSFHVFLKELEREKDVYVITQNMDNLHQKAGSSSVLSLHGDMTTARCARPSCSSLIRVAELTLDSLKCACGKYYRPNVVLFDENVPLYDEALALIKHHTIDTLLIAGTSLDVYPTAYLPSHAKENGIKLVWVNKDSPYDRYLFDGVFKGEIADFVASFNV